MKTLAQLRIKRGLTQAKLGEAIDSDGNSISRYERGDVKPSIEVIQRLAAFFSVSVDELLNGPADDELKFTFVLDMKEVESMEVRMNEFKIGTGDNDIFGLFRIPKDTNVDEIGKQFMDHLRAELVGDKAKRDELKKLNG